MANSRSIFLSLREHETLLQLLKGVSEKEAASNLGISVNTVHVYVRALYRRFGVRTRTDLIALFEGANRPFDVARRCIEHTCAARLSEQSRRRKKVPLRSKRPSVLTRR